MIGAEKKDSHRPKILAGDSHPALAEALADAMPAAPVPVRIDAFADGETRVKVGASVRNDAVFIVQPTCPPVNDNLIKLALVADAARAAGARWIGAIVPYFGYARQERRSAEGDPRSAQVAARLLGAVGIHHLITLDLHAPGLESAFPMPVTHVPPHDVLVPLIEGWQLERPAVVSPDAGALDRAEHYAMALDAALVAIAKARPLPDVPNPLQVLGDVRDRNCVLVDDIASTGSTLTSAADTLLRAGASAVHAVFTHPVMAGDALNRLAGSSIGRLVTTDSIPPPAHPRIEVISVAPILARAARRLPPV